MPHQPGEHHSVVFVVVRLDHPVSTTNPMSTMALVRVHPDVSSADADAERLNGLKAGQASEYRVVVTRLA